MKDTAGLPNRVIVTKLFVFDTQDRENMAKRCFRDFGIAKNIYERINFTVSQTFLEFMFGS